MKRIMEKESNPTESRSPEEPAAPSQPVRVRTPWWWVPVALAAIAAGVYFYVKEQRAYDAETAAYQNLMADGRPEAYETFLSAYPQGTYAEAVRARLEEVLAEREVWQTALCSGSRSALRTFALRHPQSPFLAACRARLDSMDWDEACELGSVEAFTDYCRNHSDGRFREAAQRRIDRFASMQVTAEERALLRGVLNEFLSAWAARDEERLASVVKVPLQNFMGVERATTGTILRYADTRLFDASDIQQIHFVPVESSFTVRKSYDADDCLMYRISAHVEETLHRTDLSREVFLAWTVTAELTSDHRFTRFLMRRQAEAPSSLPDSLSAASASVVAGA